VAPAAGEGAELADFGELLLGRVHRNGGGGGEIPERNAEGRDWGAALSKKNNGRRVGGMAF
jgi:hypothetical protein